MLKSTTMMGNWFMFGVNKFSLDACVSAEELYSVNIVRIVE